MSLSIESVNSDNFSNQIPESIQQLINQVKENHYEELYEEEADGNVSLQENLIELIEALEAKDDRSLTNKRFVCLGFFLALAVTPTIEAYFPENSIASQVFPLVLNYQSDPQDIPEPQQIDLLFPDVSWGYQAVDEAMNVLHNLLLMLTPFPVKGCLLDMLDDCLEGYAIISGSHYRRKLFDWFLLDLYPRAYQQVFPKSLFTIKDKSPVSPSILSKYFPSNVDRKEEQVEK